MANRKDGRLTVETLIAKLSDLAQVRPDAEVCFTMNGDGPNEGWQIYEAGLIFDSSKARVLLTNDEEIVQ